MSWFARGVLILGLVLGLLLAALVGARFKSRLSQEPASIPPLAPSLSGPIHYVSPSGAASGDGSREHPWDLATALAQPPAVRPGNTIWVASGTYRGTFTSRLTGTEAARITVRSAPGEWAVIDGGDIPASTLTVQGAWADYRDFEVLKSDPNRGSEEAGSQSNDPSRSQSNGVNVFGAHTRFINLVVHDDGLGFGLWTPAQESLIYGSLIYNNGWLGRDRAHGHGIYTQNEQGTKWILDNVIFNQYGYGIHAYSEEGAIQGFTVAGNVWFNNGLGAGEEKYRKDNCLIGGLQPAGRVVLQENYGWAPTPDTRDVQLGYQAKNNRDIQLLNNFWVGRTLFAQPWQSVTMAGNTFYQKVAGIDPARYPDNTYLNTRPTGTRVIIRPNQFEPGRANIIVYNWDLHDTVEVDVHEVLSPGKHYVLRNVQDYLGPPVLGGIYTGRPLAISMTGLRVAAPISSPHAPPPTGPEFGVFVLLCAEC